MSRPARGRAVAAAALLPWPMPIAGAPAAPPPLALPAGVAAQAAREAGMPAPVPAPADGDVLMLDGVPRQGALLHGRAPPGTTALLLDGQPLPIAADGRFLVGFDRDAAAAARLAATLPDGRAAARMLAVAPGDWRVQSLPTLPRASPRTPAEVARRADELARIAAARATGQGGDGQGGDGQGGDGWRGDGWRQRPVWPATGRISGVFGSQRIYAGEPGAYHGGVDIARAAGTPVASPLDGVVVLAADAPFSLEGRLLMIDHGMGLGSAFLHLSRIDVRAGDRVARGQPVGAIGATGRATGPHLHWAMTWRGRRIDPQPLAGAMPAH